MFPDELITSVKAKPFEPFRIHVSDGSSYEIRHPDLLWVGQFSCYVGLTGKAGQTLFERSVKIDIHHITRLEPLEAIKNIPGNGMAT